MRVPGDVRPEQQRGWSMVRVASKEHHVMLLVGGQPCLLMSSEEARTLAVWLVQAAETVEEDA